MKLSIRPSDHQLFVILCILQVVIRIHCACDNLLYTDVDRMSPSNFHIYTSTQEKFFGTSFRIFNYIPNLPDISGEPRIFHPFKPLRNHHRFYYRGQFCSNHSDYLLMNDMIQKQNYDMSEEVFNKYLEHTETNIVLHYYHGFFGSEFYRGLPLIRCFISERGEPKGKNMIAVHSTKAPLTFPICYSTFKVNIHTREITPVESSGVNVPLMTIEMCSRPFSCLAYIDFENMKNKNRTEIMANCCCTSTECNKLPLVKDISEKKIVDWTAEDPKAVQEEDFPDLPRYYQGGGKIYELRHLSDKQGGPENFEQFRTKNQAVTSGLSIYKNEACFEKTSENQTIVETIKEIYDIAGRFLGNVYEENKFEEIERTVKRINKRLSPYNKYQSDRMNREIIAQSHEEYEKFMEIRKSLNNETAMLNAVHIEEATTKAFENETNVQKEVENITTDEDDNEKLHYDSERERLLKKAKDIREMVRNGEDIREFFKNGHEIRKMLQHGKEVREMQERAQEQTTDSSVIAINTVNEDLNVRESVAEIMPQELLENNVYCTSNNDSITQVYYLIIGFLGIIVVLETIYLCYLKITRDHQSIKQYDSVSISPP